VWASNVFPHSVKDLLYSDSRSLFASGVRGIIMKFFPIAFSMSIFSSREILKKFYHRSVAAVRSCSLRKLGERSARTARVLVSPCLSSRRGAYNAATA
jgi:hypothetical protein